MDQTTIVVCISDLHCGGTVAIMPNTKIPLPDGGSFSGGPLQRQLWGWYLEFWQWVKELQLKHDAKLWLLVNGDLLEGDHHHTHQLVGRHPAAQNFIARECIRQATALVDIERIFFTIGTESHVGKGGASELGVATSLLAEGLPVAQHPDTGSLVAQEWRLAPNGFDIVAVHHGTMGRTPRTKASQIALSAMDVWFQHELDDWVRGTKQGAPDIYVASHYHQFACSAAYMAPTQMVQLPCWTFRNSHAWKVAARSLPDIGGVALVCDPAYDKPVMIPWTKRPGRSKAWK